MTDCPQAGYWEQIAQNTSYSSSKLLLSQRGQVIGLLAPWRQKDEELDLFHWSQPLIGGARGWYQSGLRLKLGGAGLGARAGAYGQLQSPWLATFSSLLQEGREPDYSEYKEFKLTVENIGYQMLMKMGWKEGEGLGTEGQGIKNPVNK